MTQNDTTILSVPPSSALCKLAFDLRQEVFVREQGVPEAEELDEFDPIAQHYVAVVEGEVVATLRLIEAAEHMKIGRVAVRLTSRGRGIAKALMLRAMDDAKRAGAERFYLSAQADKLGLRASGIFRFRGRVR